MKFKTVLENRAGPNDGNAGENDIKTARQVASSSKEDMDAYDQLGPKTKDVMNNHMVVKWSAAETLKHMRRQGMDPIRHDEMIAHHLLHANNMMKDELRRKMTAEETIAYIGRKILAEEGSPGTTRDRAAREGASTLELNTDEKAKLSRKLHSDGHNREEK